MHNRPFLQESTETVAHCVGQILGLSLLLVAFAGLFVLMVGLAG
jgi:hypothetical protein